MPNPAHITPPLGVTTTQAANACAMSPGNPWTLSGLRSVWGRLKRRLETQGAIGGGLTLHGMRHTVGNALADDGISTGGIASVLGHKSDRMAVHYSDRAERKQASIDASGVIARIGK